MRPFLPTFLVNGYNCAPWVKPCIDSILRQRGCRRVIVVNDGSTDRTEAEIRSYGSALDVVGCPVNNGPAFARRLGLARIEPDEVVILVDLDDYLEDRTDVLEILRAKYEAGAQVTYGSYLTMNMKVANSWISKPYPADVLAARSFREHPWLCCPLRTFRAYLAQNLPDSCFRDWDGNWLRKCTDLALLFPIMERAPLGSVQFVDEVLYRYRHMHAHSSRRVVSDEYRVKSAKWVREMSKMVPPAT